MKCSLKGLRALFVLSTSLLLSAVTYSCQREPWLELVDPEVPIEFSTNKVVLDLNVLWDYGMIYDWEAEWWYKWDTRDDSIYGKWNLQEPSTFNIRRYYTGQDSAALHNSVLQDMVTGDKFIGRYRYGYYDILTWNDVYTLDGVQSLHYDETTSLEYVTAYTNQATHSTSVPHHAPVYSSPYKAGFAFYQPEFLFSGKYDNLFVSDNPADYDSLIVETNTWYKFVPIYLTPVTYIYLTQVILHHNNGRIANVDGSGNLTGMARSVNLTTHLTSDQDVSVNYPMRLKKNMNYIDSITEQIEKVDIVGGRVMTFGLTDTNPYELSSASLTYQNIIESKIPNYLEVNMVFYNGRDSTFVFDVTDQVKERYKGGVITVHLDVDHVRIPNTGDGSMFDAVVEDYDEETHEIEM